MGQHFTHFYGKTQHRISVEFKTDAVGLGFFVLKWNRFPPDLGETFLTFCFPILENKLCYQSRPFGLFVENTADTSISYMNIFVRQNGRAYLLKRSLCNEWNTFYNTSIIWKAVTNRYPLINSIANFVSWDFHSASFKSFKLKDLKSFAHLWSNKWKT